MPVFTSNLNRFSRFFRRKFFLFILLFAFAQPIRAFILTCPQDYTIVLPPGSCSTVANFDTLAWSSSAQLIDTVFLPESGTILETGTTTVTLAVVDVNGNIESCQFNVTVVAQNTLSLSCPSSVQLSLQGTCERELVPQDVFGPNSNPCPGDYLVQKLSPAGVPVSTSINAFDINQTFTLRITHLETFSSCETQATVTGGTPPAITCPQPVVIECNEPLDPSFTGMPLLTGCYDEVDLTYSDNINEILCPDTFAFQIIRTWVSTDTFGKMDVCQQLISGMRFDINLITFPPDFDGIEEPAIVCNDTLSLEETASTDVTGVPLFQGYPAGEGLHCRVIVTYNDFETPVCGASYEIKRVWDVVKICPPSFTLRDTQTIVVLDEAAPVFEIPDTIFISLSSDCADSIFLPLPEIMAECSNFTTTIETPWDTLNNGENLLFFNPVAGYYPALYRLTDACGNTAEQTAIIDISQQTLVSCPPDDTITCNFYQDTIAAAIATNNLAVLALLGMPEYPGNCDFVVEEVDSVAIDPCGVGIIRRSMTNVSASNPETCVQKITVVHVSNFEVQFPADTSICGPPATSVTGQPVIFGADCENVSFTFTNQTIQTGLPGCYTVLRTWEVVNSCTFNGDTGIADPETGTRRFRDGGDGYISWVQTIHVNNLAKPVFPNGCEIEDIYLDADTCSAFVTLTPPAFTGCGNNVSLTLSGSLGTVAGSTIELGPGVFTINWNATDNCGNMSNCSTTFEVHDTIAPLANCKAPVVVELTTNGNVQVWAVDMNDGSSDNCGGSGLNFTFSPNQEDQSRVFECCVHEGFIPLELWVTDANGNQSSCSTGVTVQDSAGNCDCEMSLAGEILTELNTAINLVTVEVTNSNGFSIANQTNAGGVYNISVPLDDNYTLTPVKDTLPLNGVTTFDGVLLTRHILGMQLLNSPYKIIAADVNNSGTVTTFDAVVMRRLILQIITEFPDNSSWRFVDAAYVFNNPANPLLEDFPEFIQVNSTDPNHLNLDFVGLKVGDLNNSASPGFTGDRPEERTFEGDFPFFIKNQSFGPGATFEVPVFAAQNEIHGFQFALAFDPDQLALSDIISGFAEAESFGKTQLDEGLLRISWIAPLPYVPEESQPAFTLVFESKSGGELSDHLRMETRIMAAEAYTGQLEFLKPHLVFDETTPSGDTFRLLGHRPNPFSRSATVTFYLPEAGAVTLTVFDPSGKISHLQEQWFESGKNAFEITAGNLPGSGLYFYRLESAWGAAESRLVRELGD